MKKNQLSSNLINKYPPKNLNNLNLDSAVKTDKKTAFTEFINKNYDYANSNYRNYTNHVDYKVKYNSVKKTSNVIYSLPSINSNTLPKKIIESNNRDGNNTYNTDYYGSDYYEYLDKILERLCRSNSKQKQEDVNLIFIKYLKNLKKNVLDLNLLVENLKTNANKANNANNITKVNNVDLVVKTDNQLNLNKDSKEVKKPTLKIDSDKKEKNEIEKTQELKNSIITEAKVELKSDIISATLSVPYKSIGVSQTKVINKGGELISYITICSSVASSGVSSMRLDDTSNTKAALFGSADDVQHISKLMMCYGKDYICMGSYSFSKDSISSLPKEIFLNSIKNFFNNENTQGCMIYYSGHGFPDTTIMLETSQGSYYVSYDELISLWKARLNPQKNSHLLLILDCCYAGGWVKKMLARGDFTDMCIQASSKEDQKSFDMGHGKGSLFTNAFIYSNTKYINNNTLDLGFSFTDTAITQKLTEQQPRGIGFEDIMVKKFNLKGLNTNSWQEIIKENSPIWNKYEWKSSSSDDISTILISKLPRANFERNFCEPAIICLIKDNVFTLQGEIKCPKDIETKTLISLRIFSPDIDSNKTGHAVMFFNNNTQHAFYFNTYKNIRFTFERSNEEIDKLNNLLVNFSEIILNDKLTSPDSILTTIIHPFINLLTTMDKSSLRLNVEDEENLKETDFNYVDEIDRINNTGKSNLKALGFYYDLSIKLNEQILDFVELTDNNIEKLDLVIPTTCEFLNKYEKIQNKNLQSLKITYSEKDSDSKLIINIPHTTDLKEVEYDFSSIMHSAYYDILQNLYFSENLTKITLHGINNPSYKIYMCQLADIKSLRQLYIYSSFLFNVKNEDNKVNYYKSNNLNNENKIDYFNIFFTNFSKKSNLASFTISNCGLISIPSINPNLNLIDFSSNNLYEPSFKPIINDLKAMKNPYRIKLMNNLFGANILPLVKDFLKRNELCLEFNLSSNDIIEVDMIKLTKYCLNQSNSIISLDVSGVYFRNSYSSLIEVIRNNKQLKSFSAINCELKDEIFLEVATIFSIESCNNIANLYLSNNKITKVKIAEDVMRNFCYSKKLITLHLESVFELNDCKSKINLIGLFNIKTLEDLNINDNKILNKTYNFVIEEKKPRELRENLKSLRINGTDLKFVDLSKLERLDYLELDSNILGSVVGLKFIKEICLFVNTNIDDNNKLLHICERIIFKKSSSTILPEKLLSFSQSSIIDIINYNTQDRKLKNSNIETIIEHLLKNPITINNTIAEEVDNEAESFIKNLLAKNIFKTESLSLTLSSRYQNTVANFDSLKKLIFDKEPNYFTYSEELQDYLIQSELSDNSDGVILLTRTPFDQYNKHKALICNYNYLDWNAFDETTSYDIEYFELNSVYLKEFLKILDKNKSKLSCLKILIIRDSEINTSELNLLTSILESCANTIQELHLINTYLDGKESIILFKAIRKISILKNLNLSKNFINKNFAVELAQYLLDNKNLKILNLKDCSLNQENLLMIMKSISELKLERLNLSGLKLSSNITSKLELISLKKTYSLYIGSNTSNFNLPIKLNEDDKIIFVELENINYQENFYKLFELFNGKTNIRLKVKKSHKESTTFYYLRKILQNTELTKLDLSETLINKSNIEDLIILLTNQKNLSVDTLKYLNLSGCQIEDYSFVKIISTLQDYKISNVNLNNNKLTKASLLYFFDKLAEFKLEKEEPIIKVNESFTADFDLDKQNYKKNFNFLSENSNSINELDTLKYLKEKTLVSKELIDIEEESLYYEIKNDAEQVNIQCSIEVKEIIYSICKMTDDIFVAASYDGAIKVYSLSKKSELFKFKGNEISSTKINRVNNDLFITESKSFLIIWSISQRKFIEKIPDIESSATNCMLSEDLVLLSGPEVKIFSISAKQVVKVLQGAHSDVVSVVCKLNDDIFVTGSNDYEVKLWSMKTFTCVTYYDDHYSFVTALCRFNDQTCISGSLNGLIIICSGTDSSRTLQLFEGHESTITSIIKFNKEIFMSSSEDFTVRIWSYLKKILVKTIKDNKGFVYSVCKLSESLFATCSDDKKLNIYKMNLNTCVNTFKGHEGIVNVVYKKEDNVFMSASVDGTIKIWNTDSNEVITAITEYAPHHVVSILQLSEFSFAFGLSDNSLVFRSFALNSTYTTLRENDDWIKSMCLIQDDNILVTGAANGDILLWDLDKSSTLLLIAQHSSAISSLCKINNNTFAAASFDFTISVIVYDRDSNSHNYNLLDEHKESVTSLILMKDNILLSGSYDSSIIVWDISNLKVLNKIDAKVSVDIMLKINDDLFAAAAGLKMIKLFSLNSLTCLATLDAHSEIISSLCKMNDDLFLSASEDSTIKLWSVSVILNS